MKRLIWSVAIFLVVGGGCKRRPMVDEVCGSASSTTALIPVNIDWSVSGIDPTEGDDGTDYVHRVSLRFFPLDGSAPFDRYLEEDIYSGSIELPEGEYSVVVFNESIYDAYWSDVFEFLNVDDYDEFMAELVDEDETYSTEAYKLASWSLDYYEVTEQMISQTRSTTSRSSLSDYDSQMLSVLEGVVLQPLTCYVNVIANIQNLSSAQSVSCDVSGFSDRVYMASGESHTNQTTHSLSLTSREYTDDENTHGAISNKRLILTKSTHEEAEFKLKFNVLLNDGTQHSPTEPLEFDVAHQVTRYATDDYDLSADFELPEVSSGIDIEGWEDEEVLTIY
ncbi:MAG: DUF5119 domain-containing protein [Rikenellaceae bacterium]